MRPALLVPLAVAVMVCAAPLAAAAGPARLEATVTGLLLEGALQLDGALAALSSTGHLTSNGPADPRDVLATVLGSEPGERRVPPSSLEFTARHLQVETDLERRSGSPLVDTPQRDSESASFSDVVAHALPAREGFRFYLAPLPGRAPPTVHVDAIQARLDPVAAGPREPDRVVATNRAPLLPAAGPAAFTAGGLRSLHIEGDFVLTLWEWDVRVGAAGAVVRSGYNYTAVAPSARGVDTAGSSESRQVFLFAEGAVLDLALPFDVSALLALQPRSASLDGRLVLEAPDGRLATGDGDRPLRDGDWVDGVFTATLSELDGDSFHAAFAGTGRQAHLAGLTVAIASPAPSSTGPLMALVAACGIALLGSWRLWGRREAGPAAPAASASDDELRALRWLEERSGQAVVLWDSDLMRAFEWPAERVQAVLRGLKARGEVRCKDVALAPGRSSLGHITLTAAGSDRLRVRPTAAGGSSAAPGVGRRALRRIAALHF